MLELKRPLWILFAYLLFLTSYYVDTSLTPNSGSRVCASLSLLKNQSFAIDEYKDYTQDKSFVQGHFYSDKAPLPSILFWGVEAVMERVAPASNLKVLFDRGLGIGGWLFASLPLAVFGVLLFIQGMSLGWILTAIFGTFLWIYAGTFFGHVFAGFLVVLSHRQWFKHQRPFWGGLFLGAAFLSEFPTALAGPAMVAMYAFSSRDSWFLRSRSIARFTLGFLVVGAWVLYYNQQITGSPWTMVYSFVADAQFSQMQDHLGFNLPQWASIWGLLFSQARGLFVFAPVFLLVWMKGGEWFKGYRSLYGFIPSSLSFFAASLLLFSSYYMWNGGWAYGPRHLIPAVMLLLYEGAPVFAKSRIDSPMLKRAVWFFFLLGFVPAFAAKLTVKYMLPDLYAYPISDFILPAFVDGRWNADGLPSIWFGLSPRISAGVFVAIAAPLAAFTFKVLKSYRR